MILEEEEALLTVDFLTDQPFLINIFNELSKSGLIQLCYRCTIQIIVVNAVRVLFRIAWG